MASRRNTNNLVVSPLSLKIGRARFADADKVEADIQSIYVDIAEADGSVAGSQSPNGNFRGTLVQITTPATAGTVVAIAHKLAYVPMNVRCASCPLIASGQTVRIAYGGRAPDKQSIFVKFPDVVDQGVVTALHIY